MKFSSIYKLFLLCIAVTFVVSCVKDDDFDTPDLTDSEPNLTGTEITIGALRDLLIQEQITNGNAALTFEESDLYISGYVISNDQAGNFFEELIIQDTPSNPNTGVRVLIDVSPLFTSFEFGRKVYVPLDGLTVAFGNGVLSLGIRNGNTLEKVAESQLTETVLRSTEVAEITPMPMNISDFDIEKTNLYIRLNDVQFNRDEVLGEGRKTFAAEPEDEFDGERVLESCAEGTSTTFSTSTFADFKAVLLPQGRGTLDGILTLNFFGEEFNVVVNDPSTIVFDNTERCDPTEVDCGLASSTGDNVIFSDFFETQVENQPISGNGWTNYIEAGTETWEAFFDDGSNGSLGISARMGSFLSDDDSSIGWLITPEVNFDAQDGETLEFKTSNSFADGSTLELLFSADWDGNPDNITTATWDILPAAYIVQDDDFFGDWFDSGTVDLSCISGTGHIAWKYVGSGDSDFDGTYELDEIEIRSN
ncbi:MAG: DUF5689 domain-containing protein [Bacteroidota bacterium]